MCAVELRLYFSPIGHH